MTEVQGGSAQLRAVPAADPVPPVDGLTPPAPKGSGSRAITDVIVELGFLPRERVEPIVHQAKAEGRSAEQALLESGVITGSTTSTSRSSRRTSGRST
jgi:hypothetical protein